MAVTVSELGARVLRRLGVAAVAASDRPSVTATTTAADIATRALQGLGIIVPDAERPAITATSTVADIAERTLETLGVVVPADERPSLSTTVTSTDIAVQAVQRLGIPVAESERPAAAANVSVADVAARGLQRLAVSVPEADRPVNTTTVTATEIVNRALQGLGMLVPFSEWPTLSALVTVTDIATDALQRLGVIAADETPSTQDAATAAAHVRSVHERLVVNGIVNWTELAIPRAWLDAYGTLVAIQLAATFGKQADPARQAQLEQQMRLGMAAVKATPSGTARVAAFHAELVAIGAASWDVTAIPQAVAEDYEAVIRSDLALLFNAQGQIPAVDRAAVEERVRRVARVLRAQSDAVATVTALNDGLARRGLVSWATSAIPAGAREPLSGLVAVELASNFGIPADRNVVAEFEGQIGRIAAVSRAQTLAAARVAAVNDSLAARGMASWSGSAIPRAVLDDFAALVAAELAPFVGQQPDLASVPAFEARIARAAQLLRAQTSAELRVNAVHEALVARGLVSWSSAAIPRSVSEDYVAIARVDLGPALGVQVDPAAAEAAEARIKRVSTVARAQQIASDRVAAVHQSLAAAGLVSFDAAHIPQALSEEFAALVSMDIGPQLGVTVDRSGMADIEARVRRMSLLLGAPAIAERAILDVHADLVARGKTRWLLTDLPQAAEQPYVVLAANHVAYEFQVAPDQLGGAKAERDLTRLISLPSSGERVVAEYF